MGRFTDSVKSLFARRENRVFTPEDAAEIDDWVDEGGAAHPYGPPRVQDDPDETPPGR